MFSYKPHFIPSQIVLIGAGGTGSRLMPMLAQLARTCIRQYNPNAWLERLPIFVIDGDTVEEKNLLRQNFIQKDVGVNKASVVASRYSNAFGIPIHPCVDFLKEGKPLNFLGVGNDFLFSFQNSIIIMAVDSADARREILFYIFGHGDNSGTDRCFIIDAGNEDAFGQIKFFTGHLGGLYISETSASSVLRFQKSMPASLPFEHEVGFIPMDLGYYSNLGSSSAELSCADLPQTLAINSMMATLILSVVQNFLYLKPMTYDGIRFAMNGAVQTEYNSPRRWAGRIPTGVLKEPLSLVDYCLRSSSNSQVYFDHKSPFLAALKAATALYKKAGLVLNDDGQWVPEEVPVVQAGTEVLVAGDIGGDLAGSTSKKPRPKSKSRAQMLPPVPGPVPAGLVPPFEDITF